MPKRVVDARGRSCPEPVVLTKKAMVVSASDPIEVLVDSKVAVENICRLARHSGFTTEMMEGEGEYKILLKK